MRSRKVRPAQRDADAKRKRVMRKLLDRLCRYPDEYDPHPLATQEAITALTANMELDVSQRWLPQGEGGGELLRAFALLTLDSIRLQWSEGVQTFGDASNHFSRMPSFHISNRLAPEQKRQIVGLMLAWFKYLWPAIQNGRVAGGSPSYNAVLGQCSQLDTLASLLEYVPPLDERPMSEFQWIADAFTGLRDRGVSGARSASNHVDEALLVLLWRIEQAASTLHLKITELLPELADADSIGQPTVPDMVTGWATRLAQCVADYRAYELRQIEAALVRQGLSPTFD
jgi:hypothetical protein